MTADERHLPVQELRCALCRHFVDDPASLEAATPGFRSFGSAYAAARADDGVCALHDRHVSADRCCPRFIARAESSVPLE